MDFDLPPEDDPRRLEVRRWLDEHPGAIPVLPVVDSLAVAGTSGVMTGKAEREALRRVQTPQAFRYGAILAAHRIDPTAGPQGEPLAEEPLLGADCNHPSIAGRRGISHHVGIERQHERDRIDRRSVEGRAQANLALEAHRRPDRRVELDLAEVPHQAADPHRTADCQHTDISVDPPVPVAALEVLALRQQVGRRLPGRPEAGPHRAVHVFQGGSDVNAGHQGLNQRDAELSGGQRSEGYYPQSIFSVGTSAYCRAGPSYLGES